MIKKLRKNKKGFTLVEVIVVLVILAILIALAVPSVMKYIDDANEAKFLAEGRAAYIAADAEIVRDYADDKNFTIDQDMLNEISDATGFTVTAVDVDGATVPNDIETYTITFESPSSNGEETTVEITRNGTATLVTE